MRRIELPLVLLILVAALILRLAALDADPPGWLSWSAGLYSDEGIYSEDARLWVLYGQHMQGDFHASVIAPLQNRVLLHVFSHNTISLPLVRKVSVAFALPTLILFWLTLRARYGRRTALIGLVLMTVSAPFVLYDRMGLLEIPALFWLAAAYLALACAEPGQRTGPGALVQLFLAGLLAGAAVAWKSTFALAAIALISYALCWFRMRAVAALLGFGLALGAYAVVFYRPNQAEMARAGHYYLTHQYLPHSAIGVWHNLWRGIATGEGDGVLPYLIHFAPALALLALCAALPQTRSLRDLWLWLWLAVPLAAMLMMNYSPSRYFMIFWPALASLAACTIARLPSRSLMACALLATISVDFVLLGYSWQRRTYTMHNDARILEQVLPRDSWIGGQFAPSLCLDNSLRSMYVQKGLANDHPDSLAVLPITHVLATRVQSENDDPWAGKYGSLIAAPAGLKSLPVGRKFTVEVYANSNALP